MGLRPVYRLLANQTDITNTIRRRLISLRYTDEAGLDSDVLEIVLADNEPDHPIEIPPTGAELELFLGYDDMAERIGLVCRRRGGVIRLARTDDHPRKGGAV